MRNLLLGTIVALVCIVGLVRPKIGLFGYVWFSLMRPDVLAFSGPTNWYSLSIAACTMLGALLHVGRMARLFRNPIVVGLVILQVPVAISAFGAIHPELSLPEYWFLVRILAMAMLIPVFIESVEDLRILFLVMVVSLGAIGLKFGLWGLIHGGARNGSGYGEGTFLSGNNEVGLALAMILPLCYYSTDLLRWRWQKLGMNVTSFLTSAAIIMTYSRGAALGLAAVALMIIKRSSRRVLALIVVAILIVPTVYLVGSTYRDRLSTIATPTEEGSAESRIVLSELAFRIWQDYPFFGVGYGRDGFKLLAPQYGYSGDSLVAHNSFTQTLVDSGIFAFLFYVVLMFGTILWLGRSASRMSVVAPGLALYPASLQIGLIAFAVTSTFASKENFDFYYMLLMAAAAWYQIAKTVEPEEPAQAELLEETSPISVTV